MASIATTQPHAAYTAFTHGLAGKWAYIGRTIPNVEDHFKPLEIAIREQFLPSITGQNAFGDNERDLMAQPTRLGGLGIADPSKQTISQRISCENITAPLVGLIINQSQVYAPETKTAQVNQNSHLPLTRASKSSCRSES